MGSHIPNYIAHKRSIPWANPVVSTKEVKKKKSFRYPNTRYKVSNVLFKG